MKGIEFRLWMGSVTVLCLFASCASEPPPPPPPGPRAIGETDMVDKMYEGEDAIEVVPYPEESVEPYLPTPERRSGAGSEEVVEERPPDVVELGSDYMDLTQMSSAEETTEIVEDTSEKVYCFVSEMPVYPGGEQAFEAEIQEAIIYPEMEKENNIEGKVFLRMIVEKDGSISNVEIARGVSGGPGLSKEAVRVVKTLKKKFSPAKHNGRPVRFYMTVPVKFNLQ
jgi:periplasmic protein TonB